MSAPSTQTNWYADGLGFTCTRCGNCCSGAPGHVWVSYEDCEQIAAHFGLKTEQFTSRHTRRVGLRVSLLELKNGDCEFLRRDPAGRAECTIHAVRPVQCRTWPFWPSNLASRETWHRAGHGCPGINQGLHHPLPVIQGILSANGDLPL